MRLANPKWEIFAQARADGMNQVDSYEHAGYPRSPSAASQLNNRAEILERIQELIAEKAQKRLTNEEEMDDLPPELTREWLIKTLMTNVKLAQKAGQIAPANKAVELLAELIGMSFKNKTANISDDNSTGEGQPGENTSNIDLDKMTNAFQHLARVLPAETPPNPKLSMSDDE